MLDLVRIREKWLRECAAHDAGLPKECVCPAEDYRHVISDLVEELERLYTNYELLSCSTMGEAFDRMEQTLSALARVTAERDEARREVLELDTERPTADISRDLRDIAAPFAQSAWHGHAALMIEAADKLDALLGELANARTLIDGYAELLENSTAKADRHFQESVQSTNERDAARREAEQARELLHEAWGVIANAENFKHTLRCGASHCVEGDHILDLDSPVPIGSQVWRDAAYRWRDRWHSFAGKEDKDTSTAALKADDLPGMWEDADLTGGQTDAAPVVPACADAGVHETNGIYREPAAGAGDGKQDAEASTDGQDTGTTHEPCDSMNAHAPHGRCPGARSAFTDEFPDATCCPHHELLCRIAQTQGVDPCCGHCPTWETADAAPDADSGETVTFTKPTVCGHGCTTWCTTGDACPLDAADSGETEVTA